MATAGPERYEPTERTAVRRTAERGVYEREGIHAILDEALFCHVGFVHHDAPFVIPTIHARDGATLYLHGSPASRMLKVGKSTPLCVTVTLLDGLVLARSAFNHSMNYRSVVVLGEAREVADAEEKIRALKALVEHAAPGRWNDIRRPDTREFNKTLLLAMDLTEASAKIRTGPPIDDEDDYDKGLWAGVVPIETVFGPAEDDPVLETGISQPDYVRPYRRPRG